MTREEEIRPWLGKIETFLRFAARAYEMGYPIRKRATPHDLIDDMPWTARRYCAEQYNKLMDLIMNGENKSENKPVVRNEHAEYKPYPGAAPVGVTPSEVASSDLPKDIMN